MYSKCFLPQKQHTTFVWKKKQMIFFFSLIKASHYILVHMLSKFSLSKFITTNYLIEKQPKLLPFLSLSDKKCLWEGLEWLTLSGQPLKTFCYFILWLPVNCSSSDHSLLPDISNIIHDGQTIVIRSLKLLKNLFLFFLSDFGISIFLLFGLMSCPIRFYCLIIWIIIMIN